MDKFQGFSASFFNWCKKPVNIAVIWGLSASMAVFALPAYTAADTGLIVPVSIKTLSEPTYSVVRSFRAVVTEYSKADSCHNRDKTGKCIMASGREVYVGAVACPGFLALGTKVKVRDAVYTCEDRYATWLDHVRPYPTVDIFVNSEPQGKSTETINILSTAST